MLVKYRSTQPDDERLLEEHTKWHSQLLFLLSDFGLHLRNLKGFLFVPTLEVPVFYTFLVTDVPRKCGVPTIMRHLSSSGVLVPTNICWNFLISPSPCRLRISKTGTIERGLDIDGHGVYSSSANLCSTSSHVRTPLIESTNEINAHIFLQ